MWSNFIDMVTYFCIVKLAALKAIPKAQFMSFSKGQRLSIKYGQDYSILQCRKFLSANSRRMVYPTARVYNIIVMVFAMQVINIGAS